MSEAFEMYEDALLDEMFYEPKRKSKCHKSKKATNRTSSTTEDITRTQNRPKSCQSALPKKKQWTKNQITAQTQSSLNVNVKTAKPWKKQDEPGIESFSYFSGPNSYQGNPL